jgi:hypothetical protein
MATFDKAKLSASTDGAGVKIAAIAASGTVIHTSATGTGDNRFDEIFLWGVNTATASRKLTLEWGGTTNPDNRIEQTLPSREGLQPLAPGLILQNAKVVRGFATAANVIVVYGYVNKIRP